MERNERMRIASALAEISIQVTKRCKEDYLYELVSIVDTLDKGEDYVLFARDGGADGMDRFGDFEDIYEGIECAKEEIEGYELEEYNGVEFIHCDDLNGDDWSIHYDGKYFFAND